MVGESTVDQVLIRSEYSGLDVITAGNIPPNPTELLTSDNVSATIDALKEKYDYIFLDTPPVTIVTDAILLSKVCDGFVVVVRQTRAEKRMLTDAVSKLRFVDAKLLVLYLMVLLYLNLVMDIIRRTTSIASIQLTIDILEMIL